jgi:predicted hydrocarbon binding protein
MNDRIDYQVVAARYNGDLAVLPERYQEGAGSRRRSSLNLLNATEELLGWRARMMAMRYLQVTEAVFADPDQLINLRFNTDLCEYLSKNYGENHLFYQMGAYSLVHNVNTPIGAYMASSPSVKEAHPRFIEEIVSRQWEKNYTYKILKLTDTLCVAEGVPNPDIADSLKVRHPGSVEVCQTKVGIISAIPGYMGLPFSHAEEIKCVHRGDEKCVYEMDFEHAAQSFKFVNRRGDRSMTHSH